MRTTGVKHLVELAIASIPKPYTEDVIEDVFVAIEHNELWMTEYSGLCVDLGKTVVNNWVGVWVSKYVGRTGAQQVATTRTGLAGSYSKLTSGSKLGGKRKEPEALQLLSEFFRANKSTLPANIREHRSSIVELLVEGMDPKEAFALAVSPPDGNRSST